MHPDPSPLSAGALHLLGGRAGAAHEVADPATGGVLTTVDATGADDVEAILRVARRAHDRTWSRMPGSERGRRLLALARTVEAHAAPLAELESRDTGMPLRHAVGQVNEALAHLRHHCGWADKLAHAGAGGGYDGSGPPPIGVSVHLVPDSSGVALALRSLAPALAAGNVVVLLAARHSPLAGLALAGLAGTAGLPDDVLNVVTGERELRDAVLDAGVGLVTVTGSVSEVAAVQRHLVGTATRLRAHVTAATTTVVCADADAEAAVADVVARTVVGHHRLLGAGSRLLVEAGAAPSVTEALRARMASLTVGHPTGADTDVGPLAARPELERATRLLDAAVRAGARRWVAPRIVPSAGAHLAPTVLVQLPVPVRGQEAIAGPVVSVHTFDDLAEVLTLAGPDPADPVVWTAGRVVVRTLARRWPTLVWADPDVPNDPRRVPEPIGDFLDV